jgi:hypothetical protein
VFSPQAKLLLHRWENGPGGIRTRICDLDRVLCCRCTTGPEQSLWDGAGEGKSVGCYFMARVPNWNEQWGSFRGYSSGETGPVRINDADILVMTIRPPAA